MEVNQRTFVGVDCHKDSIACYVNGKFKEFKTNFRGFQKALEWVEGKDVSWCIEGAYSYGLAFSTFLLKSGCSVYEFNPLKTAKLRQVDSIASCKNDYGDAKIISLFAQHTNLSEVSLKTVKLKEKLSARKLLVKQRVELSNSIKCFYVKQGVSLVFSNLFTKKAQSWLLGQEDSVIKMYAKVLVEQTIAIKSLEKEIEELMPKEALRLIKLTGLSYLSAATIWTETKGKKMTKEQFASYSGIAPVECSSGMIKRYRNNKRGNRILNNVFYQMSLTQSRFDPIGREYYERKLKEGKTKAHARKCLSRRLCNVVYRVLFA